MRKISTLVRIAGYSLSAVLTQANAIIDGILHPEIPYFDLEHIQVGGITGLIGVAITFITSRFISRKEREIEQAIDELNESQQVLTDVTQGIQEGILLLSNEYRVKWANNTALAAAGLSLDEIRGRLCYEVSHNLKEPCKPPHDPCPLVMSADIRGNKPLVHVHFDSDGKKHFMEVSAHPVRDRGGKVVSWVHLSKDITERKMEEERKDQDAEHLMKFITEQRIGMYKSTLDGRIVMATQTLAEMLGYDSPDQLSEKRLPETYADPKDRDQLISKLRKQGAVANETITLKKRDGAAIRLSCNASIKGDTIVGILSPVITPSETRIIPVCSLCDKAREEGTDEQSQWVKLSEYLTVHGIPEGGIDFSHGLCPPCLEKLYGSYISVAK